MARLNFIGNLYNKAKDPNFVASLSRHADGRYSIKTLVFRRNYYIFAGGQEPKI